MRIIFFIIFYLLFEDFFVSKYQKFIVNGFLDKTIENPFLDCSIFLFILITLIWSVLKIWKGYYLEAKQIFYSFSIIILYSIVRVGYSKDLVSFYYIEWLKYADLIYFVALIPILLIVSYTLASCKKENKETDSIIEEDQPITDIEEDILGRKTMVNHISNFILNQRSKKSIAIGIVGGWGDGKSSVMELVEKSIKKESGCIIIHFNSWLSISVNSIIADFFETIEVAISETSIDVSKELKKYGKKVLSVNTNSVTDILQNSLNLVQDKSMIEEFHRINKLLKRLNKKIIVFCDDLDRLQPNEVFEVLKLIRNTASFDVFNYVVGYDKEYVTKALDKNNISSPKKYIEKIFIKEFPLPPIQQEDINEFIKDKIARIVSVDNKKEVDEVIEGSIFSLDGINSGKNKIESIKIDKFQSLKNIRDAKRFINEFSGGLKNIEEEIEIKDYLLIKLLKFSYYEVYCLLLQRGAFLEGNSNNHQGHQKYLNYTLISDKDGYNTNSFENSKLSKVIQSLDIYSEDEINTIGSIINSLFRSFTKSSVLSISYGNNHYKYFNDELRENSISIKEFQYFIGKSFKEQCQQVDKLYTDGKLYFFLVFLYKIDAFADINNRKQYENYVKILFYIGSLKSDTKYSKYIHIDHDYLYKVITNHRNILVKKFGYQGENDLKEFIQSVFYSDKSSYDFEIDYLKSIYSGNEALSTYAFPFTKEEMKQYFIFCFDIISKEVNDVNDLFWDCYKLCFVEFWKNNNGNSLEKRPELIQENKNSLMFEIVPNFLDKFLIKMVMPQDMYGLDANSFKLSVSNYLPLRLFANLGEFIAYLESDKLKKSLVVESLFLDEFLVFAKKVNELEAYIDFDFKYEPMRVRLKEYETNTI